MAGEALILVDANLLIFSVIASMPQHAAAGRWLAGKLNGRELVGLPWPSLLAFVRIVGDRRVFTQPIPASVAWKQVEAWLDHPRVHAPAPTEKHRAILATLIPHAAARSGLIHDAHLAALAIEHGLTLCSADGDFARFPGLRWENPIAPRRNA